jgi:hypothetical protein
VFPYSQQRKEKKKDANFTMLGTTMPASADARLNPCDKG